MCTTVIRSKGNRNVWLRKRRHFKKVIRLGHGNNPQLGQAFLDSIDEANACASAVARNARWCRVIVRGLTRSKLGFHRACSTGQLRPGMLLESCCALCAIKRRSGGTFKDHPEVPPDNNQAERSKAFSCYQAQGLWWIAFDGSLRTNCSPVECDSKKVVPKGVQLSSSSSRS